MASSCLSSPCAFCCNFSCSKFVYGCDLPLKGKNDMTQASLSFRLLQDETPPREIFAHCPSCGKHSWFKFCGIQRWSEAIAAACGLPSAMRMWTCESCKSTLCEPNLRR